MKLTNQKIQTLLLLMLLCAIMPVIYSKGKDKKIQEIATSDGRYFSHIKALIPKDDVLIIITNTGEHEVDFRKLPADIQKRYKYNPAKAAKARQKKNDKQRAEQKRIAKQLKHYKAKYRAILNDGLLYVVIKRFTLPRKHGGFIHVKKYQVIPVLHNKTAVKGEIFNIKLKRLSPMKDYIASLEENQKQLKQEIISLPKDIEKLQKVQSTITEKIATLMASAKMHYLQNNHNNQSAPQVVRYDPIIMKQVNVLKKQLRSIKKRLRVLHKKDPRDMKAEIRDIKKSLASIEKNSFHYVLKRNLKAEKEKLKQAETATKPSPTKKIKQQADNKTATVKARLKALKEMFKSELITKKEYEKKKQEILSEL